MYSLCEFVICLFCNVTLNDLPFFSLQWRLCIQSERENYHCWNICKERRCNVICCFICCLFISVLDYRMTRELCYFMTEII